MEYFPRALYIVTCCKMNGCTACIYKKGTQMTPDIMDQDQPTWFLKSPWDGYLWDQDWGPHTSRLETVFETKTRKTWIRYWIARRGTENVRFSHWLGRIYPWHPNVQPISWVSTRWFLESTRPHANVFKWTYHRAHKLFSWCFQIITLLHSGITLLERFLCSFIPVLP